MAGFTWALIDGGGKLEDISSTSLWGRFAMMLIVQAPESQDTVQARLSEIAAPLGVSVVVTKVDEGRQARSPATHSLSVYGPDRPEIVAGISRVLSNRGANMTDLTCRSIEEDQGEVYSMLAQVAVPAGVSGEALPAALA